MDKLPYSIGRSLRIFNPLKQSTSGFVADVSKTARNWKRSIRRNGGYWRGSFSLVDDTPNQYLVSQFAEFFYERLGCHFEERAGGEKTWEGLIYEMDLSIGNMTKRRTLDMMYNYCTAKYNDEADESQTSDPALNQPSIDRYGRREELLLLDGFPQASAEGQRDAYLKEYAWPWGRVAGTNNRPVDYPTLTVSVCGYIFTANWRFATITGGLDELSDCITLIAASDFEFLQTGSIEENTFQVMKEQNIPQRAWDLVQFYLELGDASQNIYRAYVDNDRRFYYRKIDPARIDYYQRGGKVYNTAGGSQELNYWKMKPGIVRAIDYPVSKKEYTPWLVDVRDYYADEIEFGDNFTVPVLKTGYFDESEILASQAAYERELEREREAKRR